MAYTEKIKYYNYGSGEEENALQTKLQYHL